MAKLTLKLRGNVIREILISAETILTIGRDQSNDLVLDNPAVSRFHARIIKEQWLFYIEDLDSANGTCLNGVKMIMALPLSNNDIIAISKYELIFNDTPDDSEKGKAFNPDATIKI
jgi:pSer/pThr/pTyr-binding forkhead associated (FHA) protein